MKFAILVLSFFIFSGSVLFSQSALDTQSESHVDRVSKELLDCIDVGAPGSVAKILGLRGVNFRNLNAQRAANICQNVPESERTNPWFLYVVARLLEKTGDIEGTIKIHKTAASMGFPPSNLSLGILYQSSSRGPYDIEKAEYYLKLSASEGFTVAMDFLGDFYKKRRQYSEAIVWFTKASELGHAEATNSLGVIYFEGLGVRRNKVKADQFFERAARLGSRYGAQNLNRNNGSSPFGSGSPSCPSGYNAAQSWQMNMAMGCSP